MRSAVPHHILADMDDLNSLRTAVGTMTDKDLVRRYDATDVEDPAGDILIAEIERRELDT
ncbi:hypothetical protein [Sphingomonas sp. MMS24-J13]|uniref:hypothetical protein n=1 Tax=Sphingomonas sp. MMS24-J13 TaxID=3238686 RepID=UPI00384F2FB4